MPAESAAILARLDAIMREVAELRAASCKQHLVAKVAGDVPSLAIFFPQQLRWSRPSNQGQHLISYPGNWI